MQKLKLPKPVSLYLAVFSPYYGGLTLRRASTYSAAFDGKIYFYGSRLEVLEFIEKNKQLFDAYRKVAK